VEATEEGLEKAEKDVSASASIVVELDVGSFIGTYSHDSLQCRMHANALSPVREPSNSDNISDIYAS
jgi:hypothetical protein